MTKPNDAVNLKQIDSLAGAIKNFTLSVVGSMSFVDTGGISSSDIDSELTDIFRLSNAATNAAFNSALGNVFNIDNDNDTTGFDSELSNVFGLSNADTTNAAFNSALNNIFFA